MADYERMTAASVEAALRTAEVYLKERIPLERVGGDSHSVTLSGGDGTAVVTAHRHGVSTVVHVSTDQLRTSRIDLEAQHFLNQLPYEPGDRPRGPAGRPT